MLTITDLFCGAGGSGIGAAAAGYRLVMAANHWQLAIETHAANFPDADHDCAVIGQVDPRRYAATDVLWASPECTNHSQAKGKRRQPVVGPDLFGDTLPDAAAERSRATMWDVPRFAEAMLLRGRPYRAIVVENVVEAAKWIPFRAWLASLDALGYDHQLVSLNSMHAPGIAAPRAPQSRDRLYIVFHRKGQRRPDVTPRPVAWCDRCSADVAAVQAWKPGRTVGRYRAQYLYLCPVGHQVEPYALPAAAAIDWSLPGQRIGDRAKPLSPKTIARIEAGLRKYGPAAVTFETANGYVRPGSDYSRSWPVTEPVRTLMATETKALVVPVEGRQDVNARPADTPLRTQTARLQDALVVPPGAFLTVNREGTRNVPVEAKPIPTVVASPNAIGLVVPAGGTWREDATSTGEPFSTVTTRETDALVVPYYGAAESAMPAGQPLGALTTHDRYGVAFISTARGWGQPGADDRYVRDVQDPLLTVVAGGNHHMLVRHYGVVGGHPSRMSTPVSEPMRTLTTSPGTSLVSIEQQVQDCEFRMLEPAEIQLAMAFGADYQVLGNRRERVRQLGNGVTPPAAEFLLRAVAASLDEVPA